MEWEGDTDERDGTLAGTLKFSANTSINDVKSLVTMIEERWEYEAELDLYHGHIRIWRDEE